MCHGWPEGLFGAPRHLLGHLADSCGPSRRPHGGTLMTSRAPPRPTAPPPGSIPEPPARGDFDIARVRRSEFFFA